MCSGVGVVERVLALWEDDLRISDCGEGVGATLRERDGNSTPSTTLYDSLARNACQVMGRGLGMSTSLTLAMGSPLLVATRLKLRTLVFVFIASHSSVSMGIGMSCPRGTGGDGGTSHVSSYPVLLFGGWDQIPLYY